MHIPTHSDRTPHLLNIRLIAEYLFHLGQKTTVKLSPNSIQNTVYQELIQAAHKLILHTSFGNEEFLAYEFHNIIT